MSTTDHLRPESVFGYEHQLLTPEELRAVHAHIAVCADCRATLARRMDLDAMAADAHSAIASPPQPAVWHYARWAAAAAILLVSTTAIWLVRRTSPASGEPAAVQAALRTGRIEVPAFLKELAPAPQVLMGAPGAVSAAQLLSPKATAVLGPIVEFRWQPVEGQWTYQVRIFSLSGDRVASSPEIRDNQWICDRNLAPGSDYQWQVTATRGAERITLPPPSDTAPRFRVLDLASATRLRDLARRQPEAHLLLGIEYGGAGLLDDARRELAAAERLEPGRTQIRGLLQSLPSR